MIMRTFLFGGAVFLLAPSVADAQQQMAKCEEQLPVMQHLLADVSQSRSRAEIELAQAKATITTLQHEIASAKAKATLQQEKGAPKK